MTIGVKEALEARDSLRWIVARWPALRSHLAPTTSDVARHTRIASSRPPLAFYVLDVMHQLEQDARSYAHQLINETHDWTPRTSAMPALLDEIAGRYGHWTNGDNPQTALDFCDWAHEKSEEVRRITEQPPPATWIGPCRNSDNPDQPCADHLYVRPGSHHATCPTCKATTDVLERREWMRERLEQRLMTRSELAAALVILDTPVKIRTIDTWIERRRLVAAIGDGKHRLYRLSEAIDLAARHRPRQQIGV